jgi:hypothetical protein
MAYTAEDIINLPENTWVEITDVAMKMQIYTKGIVEVWAVEGTSMPSFTPGVYQPARLVTNPYNKEESYTDVEYTPNVGEKLYLCSVDSNTYVLTDI